MYRTFPTVKLSKLKKLWLRIRGKRRIGIDVGEKFTVIEAYQDGDVLIITAFTQNETGSVL